MGRTIKFAAYATVIAAAFYVLPQGKRALYLNLAADDLAEIEHTAAQIPVEGERYPEQLMATTGR